MFASLKSISKQVCPPILWKALARLRSKHDPLDGFVKSRSATSPDNQDLEVYWTPQALQSMEVWGEGTAWDEIQYLLINLKGKVLDIACGTGKTMELLSRFPQLDVHGFDISDFLIQKARDRGIPADRVRVADATRLAYVDNFFDYSFSIGSLEHFTEPGIDQFLSECARVTAVASYHQIPISRSGTNEGWLKTMQSFHNNSVEWWRTKMIRKFARVEVLNSRWDDPVSLGRWFLCFKESSLGWEANGSPLTKTEIVQETACC